MVDSYFVILNGFNNQTYFFTNSASFHDSDCDLVVTIRSLVVVVVVVVVVVSSLCSLSKQQKHFFYITLIASTKFTSFAILSVLNTFANRTNQA